MKIAKVLGNVVSTIKHSSNEGMKLMVVGQVDQHGIATGKQMIAVDTACAGEGDYVLLVEEGGATRIMVGNDLACLDAVIVGVLDNTNFKN